MTREADRITELIGARIDRNRFEASGSGVSSRLKLDSSFAGEELDYRRQSWSLAELLHFYDRQFVHNAYLVVLKRDCDIDGLTSRLAMLRSGEVSRVELLFRLRYGPEGKQQGTRIRGLLPALAMDKLCRIPVLGILPRYLRALVRLPNMQRELEEIRGLMVRYKYESEETDRMIMDNQYREMERLRRRLGK